MHVSTPAYVSKCLKLPRLTREEEDESFWQYKNGSQSAFDMLVMHHVKLVHYTTFKFKKWGLPYEDMMPVGIMGLIKGINNFDPHKGFRIGTYVIWYIRRELQIYVSRNALSQIKIGGNIKNRRMFFTLRYMKSKFGFYERLNYEQAITLSNYFGVSPERVQEMDLRLEGECSLDQLIVMEDGVVPLVEAIMGENGSGIEDRIDHPHEIDMLKKAFSVLTEREKLVITRYYYEDVIQSKVSQELNLSITTVKQCEVKAFAKMRRFLKLHGVKKH